jgi:hypothetical protein
MCSPKANMGQPPRQNFVIQLEEAVVPVSVVVSVGVAIPFGLGAWRCAGRATAPKAICKPRFARFAGR